MYQCKTAEIWAAAPYPRPCPHAKKDAVLYHPKAKKDAAGNEERVKSTILTDVTHVLASSTEEVSILASRTIPDEYLDKLDMVEIVVRPF